MSDPQPNTTGLNIEVVSRVQTPQEAAERATGLWMMVSVPADHSGGDLYLHVQTNYDAADHDTVSRFIATTGGLLARLEGHQMRLDVTNGD